MDGSSSVSFGIKMDSRPFLQLDSFHLRPILTAIYRIQYLCRLHWGSHWGSLFNWPQFNSGFLIHTCLYTQILLRICISIQLEKKSWELKLGRICKVNGWNGPGIRTRRNWKRVCGRNCDCKIFIPLELMSFTVCSIHSVFNKFFCSSFMVNSQFLPNIPC